MNIDDSQIIKDVTAFYDDFLEAELPLFEREISGVRYWHFIRFQFFVHLLTLQGWIESSRPVDNMTFVDSLALGTRLFWNSLRFNIQRDNRETDILIANASKRIQQDSRSVDPFFHAWLDDSNFNYTMWEDHVLWKHVPHSRDARLFFLDNLHLRAMIHRVLVKKYNKDINEEVLLLSNIARKFDLVIDTNRIAGITRNVISLHKACSEIILKCMARKKVRLLVTFNHYDPLKMLLTQIAKKLKIQVAELQHGTMGKYHIGYGFKYRERLETLPDDILTFGKFWDDTTPIEKNGVRLITTGFPYFEHKVQQEKLVRKSTDKTRVVFLGQESIGLRLAALAVELASFLDLSQFEIVYKLHPREYSKWQMKYPAEFVNSDIEVVGDVQLHQLLASADVHIGVYSTTVLESLAFDKKLILLNFYGVHYFIDLIKSGRAALANTAEDIAAELQNTALPEGETAMSFNYFWHPNARENVIRYMQDALKR